MAARPKRPNLKSEFIDAAWQLFASLGYDATTIEKILKRVGVSKGAFYHYFSSKEEILDAVVDQMLDRSLVDIKRVLESGDQHTAIDSLNSFLEASRRWRLANIDALLAVAEMLMRDENIIIRHKMYQRAAAHLLPVLTEIVRQGGREGLFDVADPEETAALLLDLMHSVAEAQTRTLLQVGQIPHLLVVLQRRASLYLNFVERILGAPRGSIKPVGERVFEEASKSIRLEDHAEKEDRHGTRGSE
ncbi:MAG TPA: helix-turn-helix domain-containing protein [Acidobacteriota bacterium]|nr:helix-turn-helix domain-containing protein [Acidobacteriota bacterium]